MSIPLYPSRRTHGAYANDDEAREAAYDLAHLMNGVPIGFAFYIGHRMGASVLFSAPTQPTEPSNERA